MGLAETFHFRLRSALPRLNVGHVPSEKYVNIDSEKSANHFHIWLWEFACLQAYVIVGKVLKNGAT